LFENYDTNTHTHTHSEPITLLGLLEWSLSNVVISLPQSFFMWKRSAAKL